MASILIIEDDLVDQMAIKRSLASFTTHQFTYAKSLEEGLAILVDDSFDLIITDYFLGDGLATGITDIKTPILLMTGMVEMPEAEIALQFNEILVKDIHNSHLSKITDSIRARFGEAGNQLPFHNHTLQPLEQLAVSFGNDTNYFVDMLKELKSQFKDADNALSKKEIINRRQELFLLAHKLKSQFSLGSFSDGARTTAHLEQLAGEQHSPSTSIKSAISNVRQVIQSAITLIEQKLDQLK